MRVRKMDVFDKASKVHLVGFKGNKEELEKYLENKDSKDYSDLIDMIVNSLVSRGFVKYADNPAEIMITQQGIDMCYRLDRTGWHANDYPMKTNRHCNTLRRNEVYLSYTGWRLTFS
jgi:hypothetical protein